MHWMHHLAAWWIDFFAAATERARALRSDFNWTLDVVPAVGHDFRAMSRAAAQMLYG